MNDEARCGEVQRRTAETEVHLQLALDGTGQNQIAH